MLVDTRQIITKSQLRKNLTEVLTLVKKGEQMIISDRGKLVGKILPVEQKVRADKRVSDNFFAGLRKLRKKLSQKNPDFDSVKAIRAIRKEN